jgi:hypothetical protein
MKFLLYLGVFFGSVAFAVLLIASSMALKTILLPVHAVDRGLDTAHGIIDKTLTADNAIYNYEWFKQQKEDIIAVSNKIRIAEHAEVDFAMTAGSHDKWTFEDKNEDARLRAIVQGLESQLEDMQAQYNARAQMANRNIFDDGKIPAFIEVGSRLFK